MTDKKQNDNQPAHQPKELNENKTAVLTNDWQRSGYVTNTMPAPPNPHQGGGQKDKK
jgi:hypothetical protein